MTTTKKDPEGVNTKKDQHEKRTGSGQHEKRCGSGQHEKETGSGQHEKGTGSDPWPLTFDLNTKKAYINYWWKITEKWMKLFKYILKQIFP